MAKQYYVQLNNLDGASRHTMTQSKLRVLLGRGGAHL